MLSVAEMYANNVPITGETPMEHKVEVGAGKSLESDDRIPHQCKDRARNGI